MFKKFKGYILALAGLAIIVSSCKKDYESVQTVDTRKITEYISRNNLTSMVPDSAGTGYYYQIVTQGTGDFLKNTDSVLYNGSAKGLENGTLYFSSPSVVNLGTYVGYAGSLSYQSGIYNFPAIREVMLKMRRGGVARILLPSYLAFGRNGVGEIPANENIDLTITTYPEKTQAALDNRLIIEYITKNNLLNMLKDSSGTWYRIDTVGTGTIPLSRFNPFTMTYTGKLLDGTVFDSGTATSITNIDGLIKGWNVAVGKVNEGGTIRLLIPSRLGYGTAGNSMGAVPIPGNAILDFSAKITSVSKE